MVRRVLVSFVLAAVVTRAAPVCRSAFDPLSTLATTLLPLGINAPTILQGYTPFVPSSLAQCLGSLDASRLLVAGFMALGSSPQCANAFATLTSAPAASSFPALDVTNPKFLSHVGALDDVFFQDICAPAGDATACVAKTLLPQLVPLLTAQPCCQPLLTTTLHAFGERLETMLANALRLVTDVVCSTQTTIGASKNDTCGHALVSSFLQPADGNLMLLVYNLLNALQIPNDQGLLATTGVPFLTTLGKSASIFDDTLKPRACVVPVDALFSWIRRFPFLAASINGLPLSDLFEDGKCIPGGQALAAATQAFPNFIPDDMLSLVQLFITDTSVCFHLANGYSAKSPPSLTLFSARISNVH
ncbi:Aste57867_2046 [Aphanomyces stellatus]|uniref:Aste57867_2046 protein n=1 Tax=Aphanomyces stellatus TaxID=120398 RepID=A0A485KC86_9STRA|nr:hypothetical protein As57867_002042 [Aphanomyces stellatus]VFT79250.1 Aste57867_2046 [Aphanomyces stellatus]